MTESVSRTERRKRATRRSLLAAAEQQIATTGLENLSVQTTTGLADVALGTFYNHFCDKDDLIDQLLLRDERRMEAAAAALQPFAERELHRAIAYPSAIAWRSAMEPGWARLAGELWRTARWPVSSIREWGMFRELSRHIEETPATLELRVLAVRDMIGGLLQSGQTRTRLGDTELVEHVVDSTMRLIAATDGDRLDAVAWALAHPIDLEVFQHVA